MGKQILKPLWIKYLNGLFDNAEKGNVIEIDVLALDLQKMAKIEYPNGDFNRFPSICNAMKSIIDYKKDEESGVFNSSLIK